MRFALRDVFWLVMIAAVGVGWYAHQRNLKSSYEVVAQEKVAKEYEKKLAFYRSTVQSLRADEKEANRRSQRWYDEYRKVKNSLPPSIP